MNPRRVDRRIGNMLLRRSIHSCGTRQAMLWHKRFTLGVSVAPVKVLIEMR